jgi:hypothetical protein
MKQGRADCSYPGGRRRNGLRALLPLFDERGVEPQTLVFLTDTIGQQIVRTTASSGNDQVFAS